MNGSIGHWCHFRLSTDRTPAGQKAGEQKPRRHVAHCEQGCSREHWCDRACNMGVDTVAPVYQLEQRQPFLAHHTRLTSPNSAARSRRPACAWPLALKDDRGAHALRTQNHNIIFAVSTCSGTVPDGQTYLPVTRVTLHVPKMQQR